MDPSIKHILPYFVQNGSITVDELLELLPPMFLVKLPNFFKEAVLKNHLGQLLLKSLLLRLVNCSAAAQNM